MCVACRLCFPHITRVTNRLIDSLKAAGPSAVQDIDLAAQQVTVDVIGLAAFDRDLQATATRVTSAAETDTSSSCGHNSNWLLSYLGLVQDAPAIDLDRGSGASIVGRGGEVLAVMRHLVVAMQQRNNPLNRWFPWRKVNEANTRQSRDSQDKSSSQPLRHSSHKHQRCPLDASAP